MGGKPFREPGLEFIVAQAVSFLLAALVIVTRPFVGAHLLIFVLLGLGLVWMWISRPQELDWLD